MDANNVGQIRIRSSFNDAAAPAKTTPKTPATPEEPTINTADGFSRTETPSGTAEPGLISNPPVVPDMPVDISRHPSKKYKAEPEEPEREPQASAMPAPSGSEGDIKHITIIHTNDLHGKLSPSGDKGGMANLAGVINEIRQKNPNYILMDAGDIAYNPPYSDKNRFDPMPDIMNKIGYNVLSPGNHQWQWEANRYGGVHGNPTKHVDNMEELSKALSFPMVNCNTVLKETNERPDFLPPFKIVDVGGVKLGVTGVCTKQMATSAHPDVGANWTVLDPSESLNNTIPEMKKAGADLIIVMAHDDLKADSNIIRRTHGIDIMIGAHDHQTTMKPTMVTDADGRQVPLVEAASHTKLVSELDVAVNMKSKSVADIKMTLHSVMNGNGKADPEVAEIVKKWDGKNGTGDDSYNNNDDKGGKVGNDYTGNYDKNNNKHKKKHKHHR